MSTTYAKSQTTAQKKDAPSAASVLDASSQSESLQRKADMANNAAQRAEAPHGFNTNVNGMAIVQRAVVKGDTFEQYEPLGRELETLNAFLDGNRIHISTSSFDDESEEWRLDKQANSGKNFNNYQIQRNGVIRKTGGTTSVTNVLVFEGANDDEYKQAHRNSFDNKSVYGVGEGISESDMPKKVDKNASRSEKKSKNKIFRMQGKRSKGKSGKQKK